MAMAPVWRKRSCEAPRPDANICSLMVICALIPRFALLAALGTGARCCPSRWRWPPRPGREQMVGEVSAPAEAFGVVAGMRVGEALSRCPELRLVPPDPEGVRGLWHVVLDRIECDRRRAGVRARRGRPSSSPAGCTGCTAATWPASSTPRGGRSGRARAWGRAESASPPTARRGRPGRGGAPRGGGAGEAARLPGARCRRPLLRSRPELADAARTCFERLGIRTLGELAALPSRAVAERFGHPGLLALDLARGRDTPLEPRRPPEPVSERIDLPEAASGQQLERALELLIARAAGPPRAARADPARAGGGGALRGRGHLAPAR